MRKINTSTAAFLAVWLILLAIATQAQSGGQFEVTESVVGTGGGSSSGGIFELEDTVGQPAAGGAIGSEPFSVTSGFWNYTALAPTAAGVSLSGRIVGPGGAGVTNARIFLQTQEGEMLAALSASFGYFLFENVMVGQTVFVTVEHKQFNFEPRTVLVLDNVTDLDFVGQPR